MQSKQAAVCLKDYKQLIETIAKVEYQKLCANNLIEYLELVNIANQALYNLFKCNDPEQFNNSYLATAIKWAIRNEIRRRYKWHSLKSNSAIESPEGQQGLREAVYKTILSIDELSELESPTQVKDQSKNPEENMEFFELRLEIISAIKKLPKKERELIECKFYKNQKLKDMAKEFDMSSSRISRIIQTGLDKIKKDLIRQNIV